MLHTRPGPVRSLLHQARAHRIAQHIAQHRKQVIILLNGKTLETALPDMPSAVVVPMIPADVTRHPPLHERTECVWSRRLHHKVEMIGHETEAQDADRVSDFGGTEQLKKDGVVRFFVKDNRAAVATVEDMVGMTSQLSTRNPRHGSLRY